MDKIKLEKTTAMKQRIKELEKENQMLKSVLDNIHEGVYVTDKKGVIIFYNRESEKMEGVKKEQILGRIEDEVYPNNYSFSEDVSKTVLRTGKPVEKKYYSYFLPNGRKANIIFSSFPFVYKNDVEAVYTISRSVDQINEFLAYTLEIQKKLNREDKTYSDGAKYILDDIVGNSQEINKVVLFARKVASSNSPILIVGETGTGKEMFAQGIHNASLYSKGPFIAVNCAGIPDTLLESMLFGTVKGAFTGAVDCQGFFEQAREGTIFLDEINSMPFHLQAKLLRVLQDKVVRRIGSKTEIPINCRIISATNIDPVVAVKKQILRSDIYFRLATVTIHIPPLRQRKEDIITLAMFFIRKLNVKYGLFISAVSEELKHMFKIYSWPGNVRELENVIEGAMLYVKKEDTTLHRHHMPEHFFHNLDSDDNSKPIASFSESTFLRNSHNEVKGKDIQTQYQNIINEIRNKEIDAINKALSRNRGNITKAAKEMGMSRQSLLYWMRKYGMK